MPAAESALGERVLTALIVSLTVQISHECTFCTVAYQHHYHRSVCAAATLNRHIGDVGSALIERMNAQKTAEEYIPELIKVHDKFYELVVGCFKGNAIFHKALKEACETIVNRKAFPNHTAELLANYCDTLLIKGSARLAERALDVRLSAGCSAHRCPLPALTVRFCPCSRLFCRADSAEQCGSHLLIFAG
jgi:hypothetical protein